MESGTELFGGIEAGGTKFVCGVADADGTMLQQVRIPTTSPEETLQAAADFFTDATRDRPLAALSIGSFGPLSLKREASDFGHITNTPKPGWSDVDLVGYFRRFGVPIAIDTDVNAAAVGERLFGNGRGLDTFCYVTIGTGVGVGMIVGGSPHGGANHPEAGHILVPGAPGDDDFRGICPFHGNCLEGVASGPAIRARWGVDGAELPDAHQAWTVEADYIASLCVNLTYIMRPDRIILGGGVMQRPHLYDLVREALAQKLAGYDASVQRLDFETYIAPPGAGPSAGLWGATATSYRLITGEWPSGWSANDTDAGNPRRTAL
ncbi:transcriptional regulator [Sphingobium amiense]|uniref:fructokinase n=1 Tax=Sphingobium amiense TaxID=135719 RepID=A0A494W3N5_9SPHN|nr:ROK family protein [Sphingobium amiense]BBD97207.1 transcriptional regulator [Sphingobium amiense]